MEYRVKVGFKVHKFNKYSDALKFKQDNGGIIYQQETWK